MITTRKIILSTIGGMLFTGNAAATPADTATAMLNYISPYAAPSVNSWTRTPRHNSLQLAQQEKFPPIGFDPSHPKSSYKQPEIPPSWPQPSPDTSGTREVKPPAFASPKAAQPAADPSAMPAFAPAPSNRLYGNSTIETAPKAKTGYAAMPQPGGAYGYPLAPTWGQPGANSWARPNLDAQHRPRAGANPWRGKAVVPNVNARRNPWAPPYPANSSNSWGQNAFNRPGQQPVPPRYAPWPPASSAPATGYNYGYPSQFRAGNRANTANTEPWRFNGAYPGFGWGGGPWGGFPR